MNTVLDAGIPDHTPVSLDRTLPDACKGDLSRPDRLYDCGRHWVVVECDEGGNNHDSCKEGAYKRMINIHQILAGPRVVFVRYNPDRFRGREVLPARREELLVQWVRKLLNTYPEHDLSVLYLFYDGFVQSKAALIEIDPFQPYEDSQVYELLEQDEEEN